VATLDQSHYNSSLAVHSPLSRAVYIRSPRGPIFVRDQLHKRALRVSKPIYEHNYSGLYWFNTYAQAFQRIMTKPTALEECLMYRVSAHWDNLDGLAGIQVDDTLMSGTKAFRADEAAMTRSLIFTRRKKGPVLSWSGVHIAQDTALK
jgi:hypothetical protein